jgi:hypothetical protein
MERYVLRWGVGSGGWIIKEIRKKLEKMEPTGEMGAGAMPSVLHLGRVEYYLALKCLLRVGSKCYVMVERSKRE